MGLYRATLNTPWAKVGKVVELDDLDPNVRRLVAFHHLVPADATAKKAQSVPLRVEEIRPPSSVEQMRQALREAQEAARLAAPPSSDEGGVETAITREVPEEAKPEPEGEQVATKGTPSSKEVNKNYSTKPTGKKA